MTGTVVLQAQSEGPLEQPVQSNPCILVADDDETTRDAVRELLEDEGYRVVIASDGAQALEMFDAVRPTIVVTDLEMPHLSGAALTCTIRKRGDLTPIVLITGHHEADGRRMAQEIGASGFLPKPLDVVALLELLDAVAQRP